MTIENISDVILHRLSPLAALDSVRPKIDRLMNRQIKGIFKLYKQPKPQLENRVYMCTFDIYFCICKNTWQNLLDPEEIMTTPGCLESTFTVANLGFPGSYE